MATIRALLGLFPKTGEYENHRLTLEEEYKSLLAFRNSKELRSYHELESYINSAEFAKKKKELFELRFKQTEDFRKEKDFISISKSNDIRTYYKINDSEQLVSFYSTEKSEILKRFTSLETFVNSDEFATVKRETSLSAGHKFEKSDIAKTYNQYLQQKKAAKIIGYFKFIHNKRFNNFISVQESGLDKKIAEIEKEVQSSAFLQRKAAMKKSEFRNSEESRMLTEFKNLKKLNTYKNYLKMVKSPFRDDFDVLHDTPEIEAFIDLDKFIKSDEFKRQRKEIESKSFKDTMEYKHLQEYLELKKSQQIKSYFKFKNSKEYKLFISLKGSTRIKDFETQKSYLESDEFKKFKNFCLKSPSKRWLESKEYESLQEFENLKKSEKIAWYLKNINSKKFAWHRIWDETFVEDFSSQKLDAKKWITRYYWGEKILKDSYSLSQDKHFITDGKNLHFENGKLHIVTRKEVVTGKSWHPINGFIPREFGYTSGLISTGMSFKQRYGTFEAKIKIHESRDLLNAFWLVGMNMVPHIDIVKAGKKLYSGNVWGDPRNLKSIQRFTSSIGRSRFTKDFYIYSMEWLPSKIVWKINGIEVASNQKGVPEEPMYMVLNAGLQKDINGMLPAKFEIDWVRCFQQVEESEKLKNQKQKSGSDKK
jgi:beta-glucanase (GH16 family)